MVKPGCPMHKSGPSLPHFPPQQDESPRSPSSCPVKAPNRSFGQGSERQHLDDSYVGTSAKPSSTISKLNPLNYMPSSISNAPSSTQQISLPLEREISSIPRGDVDSNWEYPSPQQMYNAMLRKGYTDTPTDAVESMVAVHNFLNEGAWQEIAKWEYIFSRGLAAGWDECRRGEENLALKWAIAQSRQSREEDDALSPRLLRFVGRPSEPTPKSRIMQALGYIYPSGFGSEPPFDRHDWFVSRQSPSGQQREIRYVIDYYSGPPEPTGEPVFYLDIRPAIDRPSAAIERLMRWSGNVWYRASGGVAREAAKS